ncbi:hypothetical protein NW762_002970 [Fusarium torreyae]|uniref:DUF7770 domain-containing protein n=1 Tax=Fusarium torreyae TaxID=1237075 RepID=A0A9W8SBL8_9HYPO|nr:hypothetical protein NW762_002970 [Fusarium torreyae]
MDRYWDQDNFKSQDLKQAVQQVHICAYANKNNQSNGRAPPINEWAVFFETSATHSVRVKIVPGHGTKGLKGKIKISSEEFRYSPKIINGLSFAVSRAVKVEDIVRLMVNNGFQKYHFTPEGDGARYWIFALISLLEQKGILEPGSSPQAWNSVSYYYIDPSGYEAREVGQGTFGVGA